MAQKTGYLAEKLKLFHLSDKRQWACPYHYHDFDKITLFFRGHVSYDVEGTAYDLQPFDIVVIPAGRIHRPIIYGDDVYDASSLIFPRLICRAMNAAAARPARYSRRPRLPSCASPRKRTTCTTYRAACAGPGRTWDRKARSYRKRCLRSS